MLELLRFVFLDGYHFFGFVLLLFIVGFYASRAFGGLIKFNYNINRFVKFTDEEANEIIKKQIITEAVNKTS